MKTFDELFEKAIQFDTIEMPQNIAHKEAMKAYYNSAFNDWLMKNKGWKYGDGKHYEELLTRENWLGFIQHENENKSIAKARNVIEKKSWESGSKNAEIKPDESNVIYYFKDGRQLLSTWDFLTKTGFIKNMKEKYGAILNPTHDFNLLKETRFEQFKEWQTEFVNDRNLNHLKTTTFEMNCLYIRWLNHELEVIERWLSDKYPNGKLKKIKESNSTQIEITKYQDHIKNEIKIVDKAITAYKSQSEIAGGELEFWFSLTTEQKYKVAFQTYKEKFPQGTVEDFHLMEIEHQKSIIRNYENMEDRSWWKTKCLTEAKKLLKYIEDIVSPSQKSESQTEYESLNFHNNFDNVSPIEIYKHFKTGLVEKGYLTEHELNKYLKAAFEQNTIPKTLFKIKDASTKQKVMNVFYEYYKNIAGKPHGKQIKYAALLGDYFEGYQTKNVSTNFNK